MHTLTSISISALVIASLGVPEPMQQGNSSRALTRVHPATRSEGAADESIREEAAQDSLSVWRERMQTTDLAQREQHYEQMLAAARRDPRLREALEDWANDTADRGLAWTARLALRELEASPFTWLGSRNGAHGGTGMPLGFDGVFDFGQNLDPRSFLEHWQRQWGGLEFNDLFATPGASHAGSANSIGNSSAESFSLSIGPDGVTCEVKRNVDGKEEVQEYKAESLEQLLDAHPELRDKLDVGGVESWGGRGFGGFPRGLGLRFGFGDSGAPSPFGAPALPGATAEVRTDVLGVIVQAPTESEAKNLALEPGLGQRIERVEPGTIAARMGLQRGHVLIELNGTPIKSRDDITAELKKRGADGALEAVVIDRWGQRRTHTWKPDTTRQL